MQFAYYRWLVGRHEVRLAVDCVRRGQVVGKSLQAPCDSGRVVGPEREVAYFDCLVGAPVSDRIELGQTNKFSFDYFFMMDFRGRVAFSVNTIARLLLLSRLRILIVTKTIVTSNSSARALTINSGESEK